MQDLEVRRAERRLRDDPGDIAAKSVLWRALGVALVNTGEFPAIFDGYGFSQAITWYQPKEAVPGSGVKLEGATRENVKRVLASAEGENEGASWLALCELFDGRFILARAGCDYSGFG